MSLTELRASKIDGLSSASVIALSPNYEKTKSFILIIQLVSSNHHSRRFHRLRLLQGPVGGKLCPDGCGAPPTKAVSIRSITQSVN